METITWSDAFSVDNEELDSQHKDFLELIREAYAKIGGKLSAGELNDLLDKLYRHADNHFATEEKYFKEYNYERAAEHSKMHDEIRKEILSFKERHKHDISENIVWELIDFLENWLVDHIMKQDKLYVDTINRRKKI